MKEWALVCQQKGLPDPFDPAHPENKDTCNKQYPFTQFVQDKKGGFKSTTTTKSEDPANVTGQGKSDEATDEEKSQVESLMNQ
jgi:hypothetical protein